MDECPQPAVYGNAGVGSPMQMEMSPALSCLAQQSSIEVKEKANWFEAITAIIGQEIEMANKYKVFAGGTEEELFYAVEQTDCCRRQLKQCMPDCAPWNVHILYTQAGANIKAFELNRGFSCTCCCFNRPVVEVIDATSGQKIGSIQDPYACCDLTFNLRDPDDNTSIAAKGGCCQWGLCCPLPCGPCSEVNFSLEENGNNVGNLQKKVPGCCKFFVAPDVDNYKIDFGSVANPRWKALVMALAIFIDFRYFSENSNDDNGGVVGAVAD